MDVISATQQSQYYAQAVTSSVFSRVLSVYNWSKRSVSTVKSHLNTAAHHLNTAAHAANEFYKDLPPVFIDRRPTIRVDSPCEIPRDERIDFRAVRQLTPDVSIYRSAINSVKKWGRVIKVVYTVAKLKLSKLGPAELAAAIENLGGLSIKLAQFVCSSTYTARDIFGDNYQEYIDALSHFNSQAQPITLEELKQNLDAAGILYNPQKLHDRTVLGSGSIGDVNMIELRDGSKAVIKSISERKRQNALNDIFAIKLLTKMAAKFAPQKVNKGRSEVLTRFISAIEPELDPLSEAVNTQRQAQAFLALEQKRHYKMTAEDMPDLAEMLAMEVPNRLFGVNIKFKAPTIQKDNLSPVTLGLNPIKGATLSLADKEALVTVLAKTSNKNPDEIRARYDDLLKGIKRLVAAKWIECLHQTGFYNGDMHDGNVMLAEENGDLVIYFIDLGNAHYLSRDEVIASASIAKTMSKVCDAISFEDQVNGVSDAIKHLKKLGEYSADTDWLRLERALLSLITMRNNFTPGRQPTNPIDSTEFTEHLIELSSSYGVTMKSRITALFRAHYLIDSYLQA